MTQEEIKKLTAKDTVMSSEAVMAIIRQCEGTVKEAREEVNLAQAEISFKAGRREVVGWVKGHTDKEDFYIVIAGDDWQAKLKEWGMNE